MAQHEPPPACGVRAHLVVDGAGCEDVNGVFASLDGLVHEECPVYGGLSEFSLTVCQGPAADSGRLQWGWIIGKSGVPAYGCPTEAKEVIPLEGWQSFEGEPPAPILRWLCDVDAQAAAYAEEARRRALCGTETDQRTAVKDRMPQYCSSHLSVGCTTSSWHRFVALLCLVARLFARLCRVGRSWRRTGHCGPSSTRSWLRFFALWGARRKLRQRLGFRLLTMIMHAPRSSGVRAVRAGGGGATAAPQPAGGPAGEGTLAERCRPGRRGSFGCKAVLAAVAWMES